ncbi:hypothetical protein KCP77_19335 [Salmonella enterica subsp. enterica]|nr:hypothetical protein KCP77_19335 [Salmonella enterica subsp. enterica]
MGNESHHVAGGDIWYYFLTAVDCRAYYFALDSTARFSKRCRRASSRLWLQIVPRIRITFHRHDFTLQGIIVNIRARVAAKRTVENADILTTCAREVIGYDLRPAVVIFSAGRDFQSISQNGPPPLGYR